MGSASSRRSRRIAVAGALVVFGAGCIPASAAISPAPAEPGPPPITARPATLPAGTSSMWQTNDAVWALAVSGSTLYAGGDFTGLRPPGAAQGTVGQAAGRLAALDKNTGTPVPGFNHTLDGRVNAIALSPDGRTLYVGGLFSVVDGKPRRKLAAFDLTLPGTPLKAWSPVLASSAQVRALAVDGNNFVYVGGQFAAVNNQARQNVAKVDGSTGANFGWNANVDGPVNALALVPGHVWMGGNFNKVNGATRRALAHVDTSSGRTTYTNDVVAAAPYIRPSDGVQVRSDIKTIVVNGSNVYVGAEGTGTFDGTVALNATSGRQVWRNECSGATQALAVIGGVLYDGSHAHDCSPVNAFGQYGLNDYKGWRHLMGLRTDNGGVLDWFPTTNPGPRPDRPAAANELGPRALATDGTNLYVGGQFAQVNGALQQGLTRFTPGSPAAAPVAVTNAVVNRTSTGGAVLRFSGTSDKDSGVLSYRVHRNGALVQTFSNIWAHFWQAPLLTYRDPSAGSNPTYRIDAVDEGGRVTSSTNVSPTTTSTNYVDAVRANGPAKYWRFGETGGTTAGDTSGRGSAGTYNGSLNLNVAGTVPSNRAIHLGSTGQVTSNFGGGPAANVYTVETWIRTTTKTGGRIWGMGNRQTGTSTSQDRMLYMANNGQLLFGVWNSAARVAEVARSDKSYNDGYWHHVVATQDASGLKLYVDGEIVPNLNPTTTGAAYNGWWRVGVDGPLNGWPFKPTSNGFNGDVDEFAIYTNPQPASTTRSHISAE